METLKLKDGDGNDKYLLVAPLLVTGTAGTSTNPYVSVSESIDIAEVVNGSIYDISSYTSVNNNNFLDILIITPSAPKTIDLVGFNVNADSSPIELNFYEDTTVSANGTQLVPRNHNRQLTNTFSGQTYAFPTITTNGLRIARRYYGGGTGAFGAKFSITERDGIAGRWILKQDANYLIRIQNLSGNNGVNIAIAWTLSEFG